MEARFLGLRFRNGEMGRVRVVFFRPQLLVVRNEFNKQGFFLFFFYVYNLQLWYT